MPRTASPTRTITLTESRLANTDTGDRYLIGLLPSGSAGLRAFMLAPTYTPDESALAGSLVLTIDNASGRVIGVSVPL